MSENLHDYHLSQHVI